MSTIAPNWYPDPEVKSQLRYWDGTAWTEYTSALTYPSSSQYTVMSPEGKRSRYKLVLGSYLLFGAAIVMLTVVIVWALQNTVSSSPGEPGSYPHATGVMAVFVNMTNWIAFAAFIMSHVCALTNSISPRVGKYTLYSWLLVVLVWVIGIALFISYFFYILSADRCSVWGCGY